MDREIALLAAARHMDRDALTAIFELYAPQLYKYAFRFCNQSGFADEVVGAVFERFVKQLSAGQNPGVNLRAILYESAYDILMRDMRYTNSSWSADWAVSRQRDPRAEDMSTDDQILLNALRRALIHGLTEDQRHVILLRFMEGFSLKETAAITRKKVNNVKVIQNRGIAALRKALDGPTTETHTITLLLRRLAQA
jgi:RNA polymerase sigma-70 factor, ECF subfamily